MKIDHTGAMVEVTSYMLRLTRFPTEPAAKAAAGKALFLELLDLEHDHLAVLLLAALMTQVGTIQMLSERLGMPTLSTEALVTMMAQTALANDVA